MSEELPDFDLFPNGTSFMIWQSRNCDRCWKCPKADHSGHNHKCAIENAIALAACSDGSLLHDGTTSRKKAEAIAQRLKWDGMNYLETDCPEREEKPAQRYQARKMLPGMLEWAQKHGIKPA